MIKGKCFFPLVKLIKKLGIREEVKGLISDSTGLTQEEKNKLIQEKGVDFIFIIIEKLAIAETETFDFMAAYLEKDIEEIKEMDMLEIANDIKTLFMDEKFQSFLQLAMK